MTRQRTVAEPPVAGLLDLSGRVAIVTGASGGIGAGIAVRLAEAGAAVAVHYRSDRAAAEAVVGRISDTGTPTCPPVVGDSAMTRFPTGATVISERAGVIADTRHVGSRARGDDADRGG